MLDNKALDIVIGLVFIFTLYSLFATTINEFVSTILAYRHRMLERGLEQMLDGKNFSYYWWDKVANFVKWFWFKNVDEKSGIPMASDFLDRKPLNTGASGVIKRFKLDDKAKLFAAQVTNHPLYKRKAENSVLFKKPAYLEATAFSDILLDLFHTNKSLPLLMKDIETEVESNTLVNQELKNILLIHIRQANGDVNRFKFLIENWYDDTMDRVGGWYKRQTQRIVFTIGFILAVGFNINTIEIVKILSEDEIVRTSLAANAVKFVEKKINESDSKPEPANAPKPKEPAKEAGKDTGDTAGGNGEAGPSTSKTERDTISKADNTNLIDTVGFEKAKQQIELIKKFYNDEISEQNNLLGSGYGDYGYKADSLQFIKDSVEYVQNQQGIEPGKEEDKPKRPDPPGIWGRGMFILSNLPENFFGFLITALAISLGAPFWFDLLSKLVKLRASGQKPTDSRDAGAASTGNKTTNMNQRPDPTAKG